MGDLITTADITVPKLLARADLAALITAASGLIEGHCNRTFALATDLVETRDGNDLGRIFLRRPPVVSVKAIAINGDPVDNTDGFSWSFSAETGELCRGPAWGHQRFAPRFPAGRANVVITYTGGYSPIPGDLKTATVILVKHLADLTKTTGLFKSEEIGDYKYELNPDATDWPPIVLRFLDRYIL